MCEFDKDQYHYIYEPILRNDPEFIGYEDLEKYPDTKQHREQHPELYNFTFYHFDCYITRTNIGTFKGYVKLGNFWINNFTDTIRVHGGLTFWDPDRKIVGFDTCHFYDKSPFGGSSEGRTYKDREYVIKELKSVCLQLFNLLPKWSPKTNSQFPLTIQRELFNIYKLWYLRKSSDNLNRIVAKEIWINIVSEMFEMNKKDQTINLL